MICLSIHLPLVFCCSGSLTFIYLFSPIDSGLPVVSILSEKEVLKNPSFVTISDLPSSVTIAVTLHWLSYCSSHLLSIVP